LISQQKPCELELEDVLLLLHATTMTATDPIEETAKRAFTRPG
jgi:hypothetical protein